MGFFRVLRGLMAFLTIIPTRMDESFLEISARYMYLFPVIGFLIGFLAGLYGYFVNNALNILFKTIESLLVLGTYGFFLDSILKILSSIMIVAFILVIIGLQHTDGLIDFGNALGIRKASIKERVDIAHVWTVTRTGILLMAIVYFFTFLFILMIKTDLIIQTLIIAEISAKLAMVTTAWQGSSPPHDLEDKIGKGRSFIDFIHKNNILYSISLVISVVICVILFGLIGFLAVIAGVLVGIIMIMLGKQVFGGVTGDIFGATNEIARMAALFVLVI